MVRLSLSVVGFLSRLEANNNGASQWFSSSSLGTDTLVLEAVDSIFQAVDLLYNVGEMA